MNLSDSQFEATRVYHDFNGLAQLKSKGRDDSPEAIREAARQFESVFVKMMLKSMRDANAAIIDEPLFDSQQMDMYRDMYDDQLTLHLSSSGSGVGLTDVLVQQLTGNPGASVQSKKPEPVFNPAIVSKAQTSMTKPEQSKEVVSTGVDSVMPGPALEKSEVEGVNTVKEERGPDFSTPVAFVHSLWGYAEKAAKKLQVDPKVLMAQAALETGWGKHVMRTEQGTSSNNLFGIKASHGWEGDKTLVNSLELENGSLSKKSSAFRVYNSFADSFIDYSRFIMSKTRYQNARDAASDPEKYMQELQSAGYATDPDYAHKIGKIYNSPIMNSAIKTLVDSDE